LGQLQRSRRARFNHRHIHAQLAAVCAAKALALSLAADRAQLRCNGCRCLLDLHAMMQGMS
jgi:hypothetical protein